MGKAAQNNMLVFTKKYGSYMLDALNGSAIYFPVMLAQASLESGYGTSSAAKNKNNFFGVMYGGTTKKFNSPRDAFEKQVELFYKPNLPYAGNGVITANSPYEQARRIADSGYYSLHNDQTLPDYMKKKIAKYGYTKKDSADWYYSKLKGFIDDALFVLPLGKINDNTFAQAGSLINQKTKLI
jgi:flagellum-specific peptidoglycan hydrolase FlgJ